MDFIKILFFFNVDLKIIENNWSTFFLLLFNIKLSSLSSNLPIHKKKEGVRPLWALHGFGLDYFWAWT